MFSRASILLLTSLALTAVPLKTGQSQKTEGVLSQDYPLSISTSRSKRPDGRIAFNLSGRYKRGDVTVQLHGITVRSAHRKVAAKRKNQMPTKPSSPSIVAGTGVNRFAPVIQDQLPVIEGGGDPGYDYYYTEGEMTKSDGTTLVNSSYEYDQATSQNLFTITLAGVTFSADSNTYELTEPVSDDQLQQVETWLNTDDGFLARQTGIALIQEGYQQPENEALLAYYLIALVIDASAEQAALRRATCELKSHHMMQRCGCCGPGCYCIPTRMGTPIYGTPCTAHDQCSTAYGSRVARPCLRSLFASVFYTVGRWLR